MNRWAITAVLVALLVSLPAAAQAVSKCKVKVDNKTGVLLVSATGVVGDARWKGYYLDAGAPFYNEGSCIVGDQAKNCLLAFEGDLDARTPPSSCELYVTDDAGVCITRIKRCTPGVRPNEAVVLTDNILLGSGQTQSHYMTCPFGYTAASGGWDHLSTPGGVHSTNVRAYANGHPYSGGSPDTGSWLVGVYNGSGQNVGVTFNTRCVRF